MQLGTYLKQGLGFNVQHGKEGESRKGISSVSAAAVNREAGRMTSTVAVLHPDTERAAVKPPCC